MFVLIVLIETQGNTIIGFNENNENKSRHLIGVLKPETFLSFPHIDKVG